MAQLLRLVKLLLLTQDVSSFGIAYLTRQILKLNKTKFHFIGTLINIFWLLWEILDFASRRSLQLLENLFGKDDI